MSEASIVPNPILNVPGSIVSSILILSPAIKFFTLKEDTALDIAVLTFSTSTLDSRTPSFVVFSATVPETALNADTSTLFERSDCNTPIFVVASATSFAKPDSELPIIAVNSATSADKSAGIPKLALNALTLIPILLSDVILIYSSLGVY